MAMKVCGGWVRLGIDVVASCNKKKGPGRKIRKKAKIKKRKKKEFNGRRYETFYDCGSLQSNKKAIVEAQFWDSTLNRLHSPIEVLLQYFFSGHIP